MGAAGSWITELPYTVALTRGRTDHCGNILAERGKKLFGWLLLTYSFQFRSAFQSRSAIPAVAEFLFSFCDWTSTCDLDLRLSEWTSPKQKTRPRLRLLLTYYYI